MATAYVRTRRARVLRALAGLAALVLLALVATADGRWFLRAAWEEGRILVRRRPIVAVAAAQTASPADVRTRGKLQLVLAARAYAADSLDLKAGHSFEYYTDIGRDTLLLLLSGARRDTLAAVTWWFPVVGRVPYKGFFDAAAARRVRDGLLRDGYDAYLRPSSAFSTLGWFDDPLLNTALVGDSVDLANTVIHELTHNTFYAPSQAAFNESFASFVGARGAARFFRARGDTASAAAAERRWADERTLGEFWAALGRAVDSAYAAHPGSDSTARAARLVARAAVTVAARRFLADSVVPRLQDPRRTRGGPAALARWAARTPLDNAALLARRTYARELGLFDAVYAREGEDLGRSVARLIALAKSDPKDPYGAVRRWVGWW
ncbi:aminopeptidase [Gemmatimonadetes bacterium T265]|nr:aminopeptidase [Gemmatimonadetes bacterium T265]